MYRKLVAVAIGLHLTDRNVNDALVKGGESAEPRS